MLSFLKLKIYCVNNTVYNVIYNKFFIYLLFVFTQSFLKITLVFLEWAIVQHINILYSTSIRLKRLLQLCSVVRRKSPAAAAAAAAAAAKTIKIIKMKTIM